MANEFCYHIYELRKPKKSKGSSLYIMGILFLDSKLYYIKMLKYGHLWESVIS